MGVSIVEESVKKILRDGRIKVRVKRAGMLQFQVFVVKRVKAGKEQFAELFLNRVIDIAELQRLANELGLPVEAENGRAFPEGKGARDFLNL